MTLTANGDHTRISIAAGTLFEELHIQLDDLTADDFTALTKIA